MENVYSLNPSPIPPAPSAQDRKHRDTIGTLILVATIAVVLGIFYLWNSFRNQPAQQAYHAPINERAASLSRVSTAMNNSGIKVSEEDINKMALTLGKSSPTASAAASKHMNQLLQNI